MNNVRNNTLIRNLCLAVLLISHISLILFYFVLIRPEIKTSTNRAESQYFISSSDISTWANSNGNQKNLQIQILSGFVLLGLLYLYRKIMAPVSQSYKLFSHIVKVFRLSPTYILHRVLII